MQKRFEPQALALKCFCNIEVGRRLLKKSLVDMTQGEKRLENAAYMGAWGRFEPNFDACGAQPEASAASRRGRTGCDGTDERCKSIASSFGRARVL